MSLILSVSSAWASTNAPISTIVRTTPGGLSPIPVITSSTKTANGLDLTWFGLTPGYRVLQKEDLNDAEWTVAGTATTNRASVTLPAGGAFVKIEAQNPAYLGAQACLGCHSGNHANWSATRHAHALTTLQNIGQGANTQCLPCHTVGYGLPSGFVDAATTPGLAGVQCENCHGPGGQHVANLGDPSKRPKIELSSKVCGGCHTDAHHPTYDEWELSRHSRALATIKNLPFGNDSCLECHSHDYRYATHENRFPVPTKATAQLSLECSTCHSAHEPPLNPPVAHQLRMAVGPLCGQCHTAEEAALGDSPHHPQWEVLQGIGTFNENGSDLVSNGHPHTDLAASGGEACARCHVVKHTVESPNEGNPNVTGHTFNPFDESIPAHQADPYTGCAPCHDAQEADDFRFDIQSQMTSRLAALGPAFDPASPSYINPATLSTTDSNRWEVARFNYRFLSADSSLGVHNPDFYRDSISVAETIVNDLRTPGLTVARQAQP